MQLSQEATEVLDRRVQRGATLLDRIKPDWAHLIDLDNLEVSEISNCVLAQVFRSFSVGMDRVADAVVNDETLEATPHQVAHYGFDLEFSEANASAKWAYLNERWFEETTKRLNVSV